MVTNPPPPTPNATNDDISGTGKGAHAKDEKLELFNFDLSRCSISYQGKEYAFILFLQAQSSTYQ
jgi:hypothetical protein